MGPVRVDVPADDVVGMDAYELVVRAELLCGRPS
jgi:hypothetical protein